MDAWTWQQLERLTHAMALLLIREGTPQDAVPLPPACEQAIDRWVSSYAQSGSVKFVFPTDSLQRRGLLARLRYAAGLAAQCTLLGKPPHPTASAAQALEALLIDHWHVTAKARWLAGETGVDPAEN